MCRNFGFARRRRPSPAATGTVEQIASHLSPTRSLYLLNRNPSALRLLCNHLFTNACASRIDPCFWKAGGEEGWSLTQDPCSKGGSEWSVGSDRSLWRLPGMARPGHWGGKCRTRSISLSVAQSRVGFVSVHTCWAFAPPENQEENKLELLLLKHISQVWNP